MASATYSVTVLTKDGPVVELEIRSLLDDEASGLWPSLVLRVLADPPGSPLAGRSLYDAEVLQASLDEQIREVSIVRRTRDTSVVRVHLTDVGFAARLKPGASWKTYHYPSDPIAFVDGVFLPGGTDLMVGDTTGMVEVLPITATGLGPGKAWMNHPGLVSLGAAGRVRMTAGGRWVRVWDTTGKLLVEMEIGSPVSCAALSADGALIAVGTVTGEVTLGSSRGGRRATVIAAGSPIGALAFSGADVVVGHEDGTVRTHAASGAILLEAPKHDAPVVQVATSPSGDIVSADRDGKASWSRAGRLVRAIEHTQRQHHSLYGAVLSADGARLVNGYAGGVEIIDVATGAFRPIDGPYARYIAVQDAADRILAIGEWEVRVYERDGALLFRKKLSQAQVGGTIAETHVRLSPDGAWVVVPYYAEGRPQRLELHAVEGDVVRVSDPVSHVAAMVIHDRGVLVGDGSRSAVFWGFDGEKLAEIDGVVSRAHRAGPGFVVSRDWCRSYTWYDADLRPGRSVETSDPSDRLDDVSSDGRFVLMVARAGGHRVWDTETGETWAVPGGAGMPTIGGSERLLFVMLENQGDHGIPVYDLVTHELRFTVPRTTAGLQVITAPDGTFWVVDPAALRHYDGSGREIGVIGAPPPRDVAMPFGSVLFGANGEVVTSAAVALHETTVRVWPAEGEPRTSHPQWDGGLVVMTESGLAVGLGRHTPRVLRL